MDDTVRLVLFTGTLATAISFAGKTLFQATVRFARLYRATAIDTVRTAFLLIATLIAFEVF